jgi:hypothetical protein
MVQCEQDRSVAAQQHDAARPTEATGVQARHCIASHYLCMYPILARQTTVISEAPDRTEDL